MRLRWYSPAISRQSAERLVKGIYGRGARTPATGSRWLCSGATHLHHHVGQMMYLEFELKRKRVELSGVPHGVRPSLKRFAQNKHMNRRAVTARFGQEISCRSVRTAA